MGPCRVVFLTCLCSPRGNYTRPLPPRSCFSAQRAPAGSVSSLGWATLPYRKDPIASNNMIQRMFSAYNRPGRITENSTFPMRPLRSTKPLYGLVISETSQRDPAVKELGLSLWAGIRSLLKGSSTFDATSACTNDVAPLLLACRSNDAWLPFRLPTPWGNFCIWRYKPPPLHGPWDRSSIWPWSHGPWHFFRI